MATPVETKKKETKEKLKAAVKGVKKQIKKSAKKPTIQKEQYNALTELETLLTDDESGENYAKLEAILNKFKKVEKTVPNAKITNNPRTGEKYRNGHCVTVYYAEDGREVDSNGYLV